MDEVTILSPIGIKLDINIFIWFFKEINNKAKFQFTFYFHGKIKIAVWMVRLHAETSGGTGRVDTYGLRQKKLSIVAITNLSFLFYQMTFKNKKWKMFTENNNQS